MLIGLGSSLGDRRRALELALRCLAAAPGFELLRCSSLYESVPLGPARRPFYNAALLGSWKGSPRGLLALCKEIEGRLGRRPAQRWFDRAVDLDILVMEGLRRRGPALQLPHAGLGLRDFAWVPAAEVAPELVSGPPPPSRGLWRVGVLARPRLAEGPARRYIGAAPEPQRGSPSGRSLPMKIFLDTANLDEIREAHSWGVIDGVTTNPSLIAREGRDFVETIHQICEIVQGPVSAETISQDAEGMIREGRLLAQVHQHVVVKVPLSREGLKATRALSDAGIDVNVTLCFSAGQALLAAKAGAAYISPFMGRLDDISFDGSELIRQIVEIYANYPQLGTEVLAASIRHPLHVVQVAQAGADVGTMPYKVLKQLFEHPLTASGNAAFLKDWSTVPDQDVAGQVTRWLEKRKS